MKWVFRAFLYPCILFLCATLLLVSLFQIDAIKEKAVLELTKAVKEETGFTLTMGSVKGFLPFQMQVENLKIEDEEKVLLAIDRLNISIAPYNLLFGSLIFNLMEIEGGTFSLPPPLKERGGAGWIQTIAVKQFFFKGIEGFDQFTFSGSLNLDLTSGAIHSNAEVLSKKLSPLRLGVSGRLDKQLTLFLDEGKNGPIHHFYPSLPKFPFQSTAVVREKDGRYQGKLNVQSQLPKIEEYFDGHLIVKSRFSTDLSKTWEFSELKATLNSLFPKKAPIIKLTGGGMLRGKEIDFRLDLKGFDLKQAKNVYGSTSVKGKIDSPELSLSLNCSSAEFNSVAFQSIHTTVQGKIENEEMAGNLQFSASLIDSPLSFTSRFETVKEQLILSQIHLNIFDEALEGNMKIPLDGSLPTGKLQGSIARLGKLPLPMQAQGSTELEIHLLKAGKEEHQVHVKGAGEKIRINEWKIDRTTFSLDLKLPEMEGRILLESVGVNHEDLVIDGLTFTSSINQGEEWPFHIVAGDSWTKENNFTAEGFWHAGPYGFHLKMQNLQGSLSPFSLQLKDPFQVNFEKEILSVTPIEIAVGDGDFYLDALATRTNLKSELRLEQFPAKFLSLFLPPELEMEGSVDLKMEMTGTHDDITGSMDLAIDDLELKDPTFKNFTTMQVNLHSVSEKGFFTFDGTVKEGGSTPFLAKGRMPLKFSLSPFQAVIDKEKPISVEMLVAGEVAPILDFFVTDTTNISGFAEINVTAQGTWERPEVDGKALISDGTFESLNTGAVFKDVEAIFMGDGEKLVLQKLQAKDGGDGKIVAKGLVTLDPKQKFPFELVVNLDRVVMIQQDYARVATSGEVAFLGNLDDGNLEGKLKVDDARITIPEEIPVQLKTVDVTYINVDEKPGLQVIEKNEHWPIHLDVLLEVPSNTTVSGRDLHSEWKGSIQFKGTTLEPELQGSLNLIRGTYSFNGRIFESRKGSVNFNGDPSHKTTLYVVAEEQINNLKIEAILKGPIQDPVLTFRSNPPLPKKEILSWLLFNRGVEDITPFQGQELKKTEFTLSGGTDNPDLLSRIRQSFGIDRVDISNTEKDDNNEVSLKVGKYISKGLFVSVSKSINAEANQVALEANLTKHVKVQAEVGDNAQGKMSLKWENDY